MGRRKKISSSDGIVGGGIATAWGLLLSWMFCPPICIILIILLLVLAGVKVYAFFKKK